MNPRRLIALLFATFWIVRLVFFPSRGEKRVFNPATFERANEFLASVDIVRILDALVFAGFAFVTFFLALGSLSTRNSFRPADVDVLFPTPVEPKLVLIFRILRDYLLTLMAPLFFIFIGFRPASMGVKSLQHAAQNPDAVAQTMRFAIGIWLLVAFSWVCINYAASLFVNRSDLASTRNRRILGWGMGLLLIGVCGFVAWQATKFSSWQDWVGLTENPALRVIFFSATLAMWSVHGLVNGDLMAMALGLGGLAAIILGCIKIAMSQASWMYDQAAAKGFESVNTRRLQQSGDTIGIVTAQARQGKIKAGRLAWISRRNALGARALLWKEALITLRSTWFVVVLFALITVFITILPLIGALDEREFLAGYIFLFLQSLGVFMSASALSQAGFIEMLRRVDVQKPLPFSFATTILFEVMAKAFPASITAWFCSLLATVLVPGIWQQALASAIVMPFLAVLICSVTCLTTLLFPDFDDPSQRGFRGLMNFVGVVVCCAPGVLAFIGLSALNLSPILSGMVSAGIMTGIASLVASLSGNQYAQFNPNE